MAGRSIRLASAILSLTVGCSLPTAIDSVPATQAQVLAHESAYHFAEMRGVRLDAVIFTEPPTPSYAAWSLCDQHAIGFNKDYIEKDWVYKFIPALAAHEVCHIHYKDNLPCGQRATIDVEARAEECARELIGRGL